jgi:hypothetical protein
MESFKSQNGILSLCKVIRRNIGRNQRKTKFFKIGLFGSL